MCLVSAHLHISTGAMKPVVGLLSLHLIIPEEPPQEVPGQEHDPLSLDMIPCPPDQNSVPLHPWASTVLTHMSCSILLRKVPLSPQPGGRGGEVSGRACPRPRAKIPARGSKSARVTPFLP